MPENLSVCELFMSFSFFTQPKINRIANNLEATLAETCRQRWANYLHNLPSGYPSIIYNNHLKDVEVNPRELVDTFAPFRPKEHFSWDIIHSSSDAKFHLSIENARKQYIFYSELVKKAREINALLSQEKPNYDLIIRLASEIKNASTTVPSVINGEPIELNIGWTVGGNLAIDFFSGVFGLVHAPIMALASIFCMPAYALSYSAYCGSPQFFLDTALYFCNSVCQIISSVLFPLNMLYSKYTTDSFNTLTKGDAQRAVEGVIALATAQRGEHNEVEVISQQTSLHGLD
ncbi:hypothetical protein Lste_0640 [Legionella steelei]|uniref:Uncharacterized protein n=1 Tax=Legionella steelei TaxID=947033 RepID=A0A0W0ZLU9_9GAMM|nr:hypothetical protein [Legionella steelei]KTD70036.1 hypothetical protein Lste_0640 [Legionella steelei]